MNKNRFPVYYRGYPRLYVKQKPIFWWVHKWVHAKFIIREMTSVPVAIFAVELILLARSLKNGPEAYANYLAWLGTPAVLTMNALVMVFVLYHSITWFNLAPKAISIRIGKIRIPDLLIAGMNYGAWVAISLALYLLITNV